MTNRKSHMGFRLVSKSMTLDDPECSNFITHSVTKHMRPSQPTEKIGMRVDLYFQQRRYSPMTLVSGSVRFMRTFTAIAGVPWRRGDKQQWCNRKRRFSGLLDATSSAP